LWATYLQASTEERKGSHRAVCESTCAVPESIYPRCESTYAVSESMCVGCNAG